MATALSMGITMCCIFSAAIVVVLTLCTPAAADYKYERSIAFSTERTSSMGTSTETREIGGFKKNSQTIYLNIGEALDPSTGHFTAPMHGVYAFYYSFSSTTTEATTQVELLKLKSGKSLDFATSLVNQTLVPSIANPLDFASASVLVELEHDDVVIIRLGPGLLDASRERPLLYTGYMVYRLGEPVYYVV
ncbi:uncharacterized protein [Diadema setosum]|uniref:uncharacterized protein n=1 Tax=Diadema setosum TaxID=31175 RepID=UPI003B3B790D